MGGDLDLALMTFEALVILGVTIGIVLAVIMGAVRIGWQFAPWIFIGALLMWFFGG